MLNPQFSECQIIQIAEVNKRQSDEEFPWIPLSDQFWIFHFQDGSSMMFPSYFPGLQRWGSNVSLRFQPRFSWTQLQADWTRPYAKRSPQYDGCLIWSVGGIIPTNLLIWYHDSIAVAYFTFWFTVIIVVICPDMYIITVYVYNL